MPIFSPINQLATVPAILLLGYATAMNLVITFLLIFGTLLLFFWIARLRSSPCVACTLMWLGVGFIFASVIAFLRHPGHLGTACLCLGILGVWHGGLGAWEKHLATKKGPE